MICQKCNKEVSDNGCFMSNCPVAKKKNTGLNPDIVDKIMKARGYEKHFQASNTVNYVRDFGIVCLHCTVYLDRKSCEISNVVGFNAQLTSLPFYFFHENFRRFEQNILHYALVCKQNPNI